MAGYLPDEANADAFADGWYRTGDVGWLEPEGWVHLTDRSKEMIKVNGFQVAPAEIEAVLHGHPAVLDCAVFGLADERAGEVPVAVVQLDPERPVDGRRAASARRRLARHLQAPAPPGRRRRHPAAPVGQGAAPHAARRAVAVAARLGARRLMDVRLSPEQQALRDSAAQVVDRLGPQAVGQLDDPRARAASSTPRSPRRVGASCGRPATDRPPLASGVEVAIVAEELGRGLADAPFLGPTLAAELRRLAGAPVAALVGDGRARTAAR